MDYTYLHPEVLESRCIIDKQKLVLNNKENREEYSVLIVPGGDTLSAAAARKVKEFYDGGGTVIATSELPIYRRSSGATWKSNRRSVRYLASRWMIL